jgi:PKD domain/Fibronectin type III domain
MWAPARDRWLRPLGVRSNLGVLSVLVLGSLLLSGMAPGGSAAPARSTAQPSFVPARSATSVSNLPAPTRETQRSAPSPSATMTLGTSGASPTALALNWTEETFDFANYTVQRSPNGSAGSWTSVAVLTTDTSTSYTDTQLAPGSTAWWQVVEATGLFGTTTSNAIEVTQPEVALLNFTTPTTTSVQFNWTNGAVYGSAIVFGAYDVFEQINGGAPAVATSIASESSRSYTIQGLSSGTSYAFYVNTSDCVGGCGTTPVYATTQSNVVTFGTPLPLTASVTALRGVIDTGQADLLTCTYSGGESPFNFTWNSGNGTFEPGGISISVSYATPGPESVACRVTDNAHTVATATPAIVTVNALPTLTILTNRSAADVGQLIGYTCSAVNGTAPVILTWSFGDGVQLSGGIVSHSYTGAGSFLAACSAVDGAGTVVQASTTLTISPTVSLTASASSLDAAPGTALTFRAVATNGSGTFTNFTWTFGDGTSAYSATEAHAFSAAGPYTARVAVSDSNGGRASAQVSVTILDLVDSVTFSPRSALVGQSIAFEAAPSGGAGAPFNVTWTFGDGSFGYGPNVTHNFSASGSFNVSVVVTDALGAKNTTTLPAIAVATPTVPGPWFTTTDALALLVLLVLVVLLIAVVVRRRRTRDALDRVQGRIPPSDPSEVTRGAKVCRNCGTSNLPLRETCVNCGRPLRRS